MMNGKRVATDGAGPGPAKKQKNNSISAKGSDFKKPVKVGEQHEKKRKTEEICGGMYRYRDRICVFEHHC